jgi:hypothetical protein
LDVGEFGRESKCHYERVSFRASVPGSSRILALLLLPVPFERIVSMVRLYRVRMVLRRCKWLSTEPTAVYLLDNVCEGFGRKRLSPNPGTLLWVLRKTTDTVAMVSLMLPVQ